MPIDYSQICQNTGKISSSRIITKNPGMVTSILIRTDGTNAATVTLYDGESTAVDDDKIRGEWYVQGASGYGGRNWPENAYAPFYDGLYIGISGTGAWAIVEHK